MSTFCLDYENGNDTNDGSDWAHAWKTITSGATAARIAPGDTIRIAKSPDPVSIGNGTLTDLSKTVTLATAQTATVENCESAYTAGTNCTVTADTTYFKQGSKSCKIVTAAGVTAAQKLAYYTIASTDFSAYQKLSFWFRPQTTAPTDGLIKVCLCSDTAGDTIVDEFSLTGIVGATYWMPLTIAKSGGGNLGAAIQSIAIYTTGSYASKTIYLDHFIACTTSGLNLQSLIGKNTGDEGWFPIQSIVDTTILIDNGVLTLASAGQGYSGTSETVTTYKRETIKTTMAGATKTAVQSVQDSGTVGSLIAFEGGYNTSNSAQDGETFFDGLNGLGSGIYISSKNFVSLNKINAVRYYLGYLVGTCNCIDVTTNTVCGCSNYGISWGIDQSKLTAKNLVNNSAGGIVLSGMTGGTTSVVNANSNITHGFAFDTSSYTKNNYVKNANNNGNYGIRVVSSYETLVRVENVISNATAGIYSNQQQNIVIVNNLQNTNPVDASLTSYSSANLVVQIGQAASALHRIYYAGGTIATDTTTRHTASGMSWKLSPTSTTRNVYYPLTLSLAKIACAANALVTVKAWMRRDNTGITGKLVCRGGQIAGVTSDVTASISVAADTWEELTVTFTPTEAGVVEIEAWAYGGTTYSVYVDDMTITQA